jgi:hypothetical protein
MAATSPASITGTLSGSMPFWRSASRNMACGWKKWSTMTGRPTSVRQSKGSGRPRPATKNPSRSLRSAKWRNGSVSPRSHGPKLTAVADCATCTLPSRMPSAIVRVGVTTSKVASRPSSRRYPPDMVSMSGL